MRTLIIAAAAVALVACAGDTRTRATAALAVACGSIGKTLQTLAPFRADGKLTDDQVSIVNGVQEATRPACKPGSAINPAEVVGFVEEASDQLKAIVTSSRGSL